MLSIGLLLLSAVVQVNGRSLGKYARVVRPEIAAANEYDFIIAGGGIAGLTVADRLTEDPDTTVLVVEYGSFDNGEDSVLVPGLYNPGPYLYPVFFSAPQPGLNNISFPLLMGGVVGGGSTVNAMFFHRGSTEDYASWRSFGNKGWEWDDLLPYFKKSETFTQPDAQFAQARNISWDNEVHGSSGPVQASYSPYDYESGGNFWNGAKSLGISEAKDSNNGDPTGLFWLLRVLDPTKGSRSYARTAHYDRVINSRPNYHILPQNAVSKVVFDKKKAVGIEYVTRSTGEKHTATAKKEVIMAAGAVHSPQILQLSGVGPKPLLDRLGIPVIIDLPGVGQNFQDQLSLAVNYEFTSNHEPNGGSLNANATYDAEQHAIYESTRKGAYTLIRTTGNQNLALPLRNTTTSFKSIIDAARGRDAASVLPPNTDSTVLKGYEAQRERLLDQFNSLHSPIGSISWNTGPATTIYMLHPLSRGTIEISSTDPLANPVVDFRSLSDPTDLDNMLALFRKNRDIMATPSMQELGPTEIAPTGGFTTDEELKAALRASIQPSNAHQCCTLPMMKKAYGGVVDRQLQVYGVKNLSVVDLSIFPFEVGTAPSATVYAIGEKAADIIKERHKIST